MEKDTRRREPRKKNRRSKTSSILSNLILMIAVCVFVYSAYNLWMIFSEYNKGSSEYEDIYEQVITIEVPKAQKEDKDDVEAPEEEEVFLVDFDKLQSMNSDVIGWIRFKNPKQINYPIVYGVDNEKYLKTTFEGKKNSAGAIFTDMVNGKDFNDWNTFIYGHNMKNGSMFAMLRKYKNKDFYQENPFFYIYTPDGMEAKYQIFSVTIVEDPSESYTKQYADDAAYEAYLKYIQSKSLYNTGVSVDGNAKIVSLSTCTNVIDNQRFLIHAVKVEEEQIE